MIDSSDPADKYRGTDMVMGCFAYIMMACCVIIVVSLTVKLLIWCVG